MGHGAELLPVLPLCDEQLTHGLAVCLTEIHVDSICAKHTLLCTTLNRK